MVKASSHSRCLVFSPSLTGEEIGAFTFGFILRAKDKKLGFSSQIQHHESPKKTKSPTKTASKQTILSNDAAIFPVLAFYTDIRKSGHFILHMKITPLGMGLLLSKCIINLIYVRIVLKYLKQNMDNELLNRVGTSLNSYKCVSQ